MKNSPYLDKPFIPLAVASRYARDSFLSRGVVSATLPAQGADNNTAYSGAVPACGLGGVFGATLIMRRVGGAGKQRRG